MADYSARIKLIVDGIRQLTQVEAKVKELQRLTAGGWRVDIANNQQFKQLNANLDAAKQRALGFGQTLTAALNRVTQTARDLSAEAVRSYRAVADAIRSAFDTVAVMAFGDALDTTLNVAANYRQTILSLLDTVGALRTRQTRLQAALNNTNSSTDTAARIAGRLVNVTRRLNAEQREQNDLIRDAAGLQSQSDRDAEFYRRRALLSSRRVAEERAQALSDRRQAEQSASEAARARLAAEIKQRQDSIQAIYDETAAIRAREAAIKAERGPAFAREVVDRRGAQTSPFPIGPNQRTSGVGRFGAVSNEEIDAAMLRGMMRRRQDFYEWERKQPRTVYTAWDTNFFGPAIQGFQRLARDGVTAVGGIDKAVKNLGKRLQGATVGGAFPLLFGQGPEAAVGGALGAFLLPGGGGFAGSLIGTVLGDLKNAEAEVSRLSTSFGYSATQAQTLAKAFELAGQDADNLRSALVNVQGLGITSTEEISLLRVATELSEEYDGKVDKITQSLANTLEQGKVTISSITNLTSQGIPVQEKLAEKLGVTREELFKLARDGQVNVQDLLDVVVDLGIEAENSADKGKTGFEQFTDASKDLATAVAGLAETLTTVLAPAIQNILTLATRALTAVNNLLNSNVTRQMGQAGLAFTFGLESQGIDNIRSALNDLNKITPTTIDQTDKLLGNLDDMRRNLTRVSPGGANAAAAEALQGQVMRSQNRLLDIRKGLGGAAGAADQPIGRIQAPFQLPPSGSGARGNGKRDAEQAANLLRSLQSQAGILETQSELDREILEISSKYEDNLAKINQLKDQSLRKELEAEAVRVRNAAFNATVQNFEEERSKAVEDVISKLQAEQNELKAITDEQKDEVRLQNIKDSFARQNINLKATELQAMRDLINSTRELKEEEKQRLFNQQQIASAVNATGSQITNLLTTAIEGTDDWNKVLRDTLSSLSKIFIKAGLTLLGGDDGRGLFSILSGTFTGKASGGPVTGGAPYVVGERGPELFVPGMNGGVMSNSDLRSAMGAAPGTSGGTVLNMSFETTNIAGVEYVSREQLEAAMAATRRSAARDGAKQGMTMTLDRLQQSPSTRRRTGI